MPVNGREWRSDAGMKGLILTAKHHDGFCLWPSAFTEHSVKRSPWRDGKGDVVRELAEACREHGLEFGVYLSPWDRNHADYGRPAYLDYYRRQLRELLTNYGTLFEVWFDGANGGDGYYGGARETRRIDNRTYYDWPVTWDLVRQLQPRAVMFSDAGPDVRWVGNEKGIAFETTWYGLDRQATFPGDARYEKELAMGRIDASDWVPPEVDVSIRPGWFHHAAENDKVKTVDQLLEIYYASVGRGANLLLNIPPDRRGLIPDVDAQRLREFRRVLDRTFARDLARAATATAATQRGIVRPLHGGACQRRGSRDVLGDQRRRDEWRGRVVVGERGGIRSRGAAGGHRARAARPGLAGGRRRGREMAEGRRRNEHRLQAHRAVRARERDARARVDHQGAGVPHAVAGGGV